MKIHTRFFCTIGLAFGGVSLVQATPNCFVNAAAPGGAGKSWADAYADLQSALTDVSCNEIWVAKGVYKPTSTTDRSISFNVKPGTTLIGGFAGIESMRDPRDLLNNVTVLSGDIDNDDLEFAGDQIDVNDSYIRGDNSYHVVRFDGNLGVLITPATILDGFTITGGSALDAPFPSPSSDEVGGGIYCDGAGTGSACDPTLSSLTMIGNRAGRGGALFNDGANNGESNPNISQSNFSGNFADDCGGAIYNSGYGNGISSPNVTDTRFLNNLSHFCGGAIDNDGGAHGNSAPMLKNVFFVGNSSGDGGAVYNDGYDSGSSDPTIVDSLFSANQAHASGGAIYNAGYRGASSPLLSNITFSQNRAFWGGAIYNDGSLSGASTPVISNATFSGNVATSGHGAAVYDDGTSAGLSNAQLSNVIIWDNAISSGTSEIYNDSAAATLDHSIVDGGCPDLSSTCAALFTSDPLLSTLSNHGGFTWTMIPSVGSSAIDNGNNDPTICTLADQRGAPRSDGLCDIGAVERQSSEDIIFKNGFDTF